MDTQRLIDLGKTVQRQREALYPSKGAAAKAGGIGVMTWSRVEDGLEVRGPSYAGVDRALGWGVGSCRAWLDDGLKLPPFQAPEPEPEPEPGCTEIAPGIWELHARPADMREHTILKLALPDSSGSLKIMIDGDLPEDLEVWRKKILAEWSMIARMAEMQSKLDAANDLGDLNDSRITDRTQG